MIKLILFLILLFLILNQTRSSFGSRSKFKNNGFANITASYTRPKVYPNLVTPQEAEHIIKTAKDSFKESETVGGFNTNIRKSKTKWLYKDDPVVYNIIKRIATLTGNNMDNAEPLQVVQYEPGGFYNDHHDSCCDDQEACTEFVQNGGQRVLTVLIYLNDAFTGGATRFSTLNEDIKPDKYSGIIFRPLADNTNMCHPLGLHKGTPVISGVKYVCNIWFRESEYT
jgi:prolyl 4-hydroxylase